MIMTDTKAQRKTSFIPHKDIFPLNEIKALALCGAAAAAVTVLTLSRAVLVTFLEFITSGAAEGLSNL